MSRVRSERATTVAQWPAAERSRFAAAAATAALALAPIGAGVFVRLYRVQAQLLYGDELHPLNAAVLSPLRDLLTRYSATADHTPPLAALWHLLWKWGVPLTEGLLRLPSLLAGILLLCLAPRAARALGAPCPPWLLAWLVALVPGLVFYSRIARAYMPVVLLASIALYAFIRWWQRPRVVPGGVYVLCAALSVWLFPGAAPYAGSVFVFAAASKLIARRSGPPLRALLALAGAWLAALAAFLVPAFRSFVDLLEGVSTTMPLEARTIAETAQWLAGTRGGGGAVVFWSLAGYGLWVLARRSPLVAAVTGCAFGCEIVALYSLRPGGFQNPVMAGRFVLVILPAVLLWVAAGLWAPLLAACRSWGARAERAAAVAAALGLFGWVWLGPLVDRTVSWSSTLHSEETVWFTARPAPSLPAGRIPGVYPKLAELDEPGAVLEYTGAKSWDHITNLIVYQSVHRRALLLAPEDRGLYFSGVRLRHFVEPEVESFRAAPARFLIVHRATARELDRIAAPGWPDRFRMAPAARRAARKLAERMERRLVRAFGPPWYSDQDVAAWDLAAVRAAG